MRVRIVPVCMGVYTCVCACVYVHVCMYVCMHEHRGGGIYKNLKPIPMKRLTDVEECGIILLDSERVARRTVCS